MSDHALRELERGWHTSGTWESWQEWVRVLVRAGDDRGVQLDKARRAARGWLVCSERAGSLARASNPARVRRRRRWGPMHTRLRRRAVDGEKRYQRAFCRAMTAADRLGVALDMDGPPLNWDAIGVYDAKALFEALAHTCWNTFDKTGKRRPHRRRVLLSSVPLGGGSAILVGGTGASTGAGGEVTMSSGNSTAGGLGDWMDLDSSLFLQVSRIQCHGLIDETGYCGSADNIPGFEGEIQRQWGGGVYEVSGMYNGRNRVESVTIAGESLSLKASSLAAERF